MNQYPNAYCVKCGDHTATENKHTVILQSQARALHGKCPKCGSDVFKFLKKKNSKSGLSRLPLEGNKKGATVTSLHEERLKRRSSDNMSELERRTLELQEKKPIDYVLMTLGLVATACLVYLVVR